MKKGKKHGKKKGRRNDAAPSPPPEMALGPPRPKRRGLRLSKTAQRPPWQSIAAAVLGGGLGAAVGGLVVNQKILTEQSAGLGLLVGGAATAYLADGTARIAGTAIAGAGAGQLALAAMAKQAAKNHAEQPPAPPQPANDNAPPQRALPAPPPAPAPPPVVDQPPRKSAFGGGVVGDLFRDAASDLAILDEDEWRYGMRDEPRDAASSEPIVVDLDEAA